MNPDVTAILLSRLQFAFTISFHIIFPAFTIGLAAWLAVLEALHLATGLPVYRRLFDFWLKIFGVAFGLGVVSGIVMAFQFGSNWSELSLTALGRLLFRHDLRSSAIQGLSCGFPNMAYCGPPVLAAVVGPAGLLAVLIGNLITSLILIPASLVLLHSDSGKASDTGRTKAVGPSHQLRLVASSLVSALKQPLVFLPVVGAFLALIGVHRPPLLTRMTNEIGSASGGVALFALGLMLQGQKLKLDLEVLTNVAVKNILQPPLLLAATGAISLRR